MIVKYDILSDKTYVEIEGKHTECAQERIKGKPVDQISEPTALEIAQKAYSEADSALSGFIANMKADIEQKNELVILGIVSGTEVSDKKAYYKPLYEALKSDYDMRKAELKAML